MMLHRYTLIAIAMIALTTALPVVAQDAKPELSPAETELKTLCKLIKGQPDSVTDKQVVEAVATAAKLNHPFEAEQALRIYLASQTNPSQAVRLAAIDSAQRVGDYNSVMVRCKRYLGSAKPGAEATKVAGLLYTVQIDVLGLFDDAYRAMGSDLNKLCTGPTVRKFDAWYLRQAAERRDYNNLARRLSEAHASGLPAEQLAFLYANYVDLLLSATFRPSAENQNAADDLQRLAGVLKDNEQTKQRCALYAASLKFAGATAQAEPEERAKQFAPLLAAAKAYTGKVVTAKGLYDVMYLLGGSDHNQFGTYFSEAYQGKQKKELFVQAFAKLPVAEQQAMLLMSRATSFATREQWTELTAKYPNAFQRINGIPLAYVTVADCKRLAPSVLNATDAQAMVIRAIASGRDFGGCIDQLVAQDAWHQGGYDHLYSTIRSSLRSTYQNAMTAEKKPLPPKWYEKAIIHFGSQHVAKTPLALGTSTTSEYVRTVWSTQPKDIETTLDSLTWVPYTPEERKAVFDPAFGEFVRWADEARKRRQGALENVAASNKKVDEATAELSKTQSEKKPANEIKDAENRVKAEKQQLAKYNDAVKAADADVARISPVEQAFKRVMQVKAGDPGRAPNAYCKHLSELVIASHRKDRNGFVAAGKNLYPLVKDSRSRKTPVGRHVMAVLLRTPQEKRSDFLEFELEILADQLKSFNPTSVTSLADINEVTNHIMASHMSWSFSRIPKSDQKKAMQMHDVFADAMSAQIDRGQFSRWLFDAVRGTRVGTGWGNQPKTLVRSEELVDKMIQKNVLAKSDFRHGGQFASTTYMYLVRNECRGLAEKYPVETFFDAQFLQEAAQEGYIDETYFQQGGQDKERKIHALAADLISKMATVPVDARKKTKFTYNQFLQTQSRAMGAEPAKRDALLTKVETSYGKTRFGDVAMGRSSIGLIGDMADAKVREDYFKKLSTYLDRAAASSVRMQAPNLHNVRTINREQPLTDQEFATILRVYSPECGLSGTYGNGANEMLKRILPEMISAERRGELFVLAPYLWKIAAYDSNFQKQFIDQIVSFQKEGQYDLAASLSGVGIEMFEGQVRDTDKNRLSVARAQSLLNVGGMADLDTSDPRYSILSAQSDFLTSNLERSWQSYTKNRRLAVSVVQQLEPAFVVWLIRRNTALTDFEEAEELAREALQKMETHPEQFSQEARAKLLLAYANIAFERPEYPRARALFGRIAAAQEFAGTRSQVMAQLRVAEVDRVTKHYGEAIDRLEKLAKGKDLYAQRESHFCLAKVLFDQEQYADALKEIELVFNYDSTHAAARIFEGRVNLRIKRLEQASRIDVGFLTDQQFIVPGEPLRIGLRDQALAIAGDTRAIEMRAWTDAGDEEHFSLVPFADSKTQFEGQVTTSLGKAEKGDHTLQLLGNDKVHYDFSERFKKSHNIENSVDHFMVVLSDSSLFTSSGKILTQEELEQQAMERAIRSQLNIVAKKQKDIPLGEMRAYNQIKPGNPINVRVIDPDQSVSNEADKMSVVLSTTSGDQVTFDLTETGGNTGIFDGAVPTASAMATALASDSEQGSQPVFVISAGDHPAWVGQPDNKRPKTFAVDLNASERLGTMKIDANVPGRRLKQFLVQTSIDGKKFETVGSYPEGGAAWDGSVRLVRFPVETGTNLSVAAMQEALANTPSDSLTITKPETFDAPIKSKGSEVLHYEAAFHFPTRQIATFQVVPTTVKGGAVYHLLVDGQRAQELPQAEDEEADPTLQFKGVLGQGVHKIDIFVSLNKNSKSTFQLLHNIDEPPYVEACPMEMFDPAKNEIVAKMFADRATTVKGAEDGGSFQIAFGTGIRARVVRLLLADFETDAPAIEKIQLTAQDERQVLPAKVDLLSLKTNQVLEIVPGDRVSVVYRDPRFIVERNQVRESFLSATYANGEIDAALLTGYTTDEEGMRQPNYIGLRRFKSDDTIMVVINDSDADTTEKLDTVPFTIRTADGEPVDLQALETTEHSGVFLGKIFAVEGKPERKSEIQVLPGEDLVLTYMDQENTAPGIPWERTATIESVVYMEPEFRVFNTESSRLSDEVVAVERTKQGTPDFVPVSRTLAAVRPAEIDIKEVPNAIMGAPFICELVWPTIAQTTASTADIFVQTSSGRKAYGKALAEGFDINVPGTIRIRTNPSGGGGGAAPPGYRGMVVVSDPGALDPMDDGRFTFTVPMRLAPAATESFATDEAIEKGTEETLDEEFAEDLSSLIVKGDDELFVGFRYTNDSDETVWVTRKAALTSNPFFHIMNRSYSEMVDGVYVGQSAHFRVIDPSKDATDERDRVTVTAGDAAGKPRTVELIETFAHSGEFKGPIKFLYSDESTGELPPGSVGVTYGQEVETAYEPVGDDVEALLEKLEVFKGSDGDLQPFTKRFEDPLTAVRTRLTIAEAYFELAKKHRQLGQDELTEHEIATGKRLLEEALRDYPDTEARAQVDYLLANLSLEFAEEADDDEAKKKYFLEALGRFSSIVSNYRDSAYAPKAQFKKALTLEQMGEIERASEEYVKLSYRWPDSPLIADTIARLGQYFFKHGMAQQKIGKTLKAEGTEKVALAEEETDEGKAEKLRDESTETLISAKKAHDLAIEHFITAGKVFGRLSIRFPSHRLANKTTALSGQCFMRAEEYDDAVAAFKKVYANEKADKDIRAESYYWAGDSYLRKIEARSGKKDDNLKQAYLVFKQLTLYFPESKWSRYARGRLTSDELIVFDTPVEEEDK